MPRLIVVMDENNKLLGAVRSGPIQAGNVTVQFRPHPGSKHKHHEVEVPDEAMRSVEELRKHLQTKAAAARQ